MSGLWWSMVAAGAVLGTTIVVAARTDSSGDDVMVKEMVTAVTASTVSADSASAELARPAPVSGVNATSEEFQRAGEEIEAAQQANPSLAHSFEPFITDPIDITEPGEYRVPLSLPPGTNTHDVGLIGPGDITEFMSMDGLRLEPEGPVVDGMAELVMTVSAVYVPYNDFQMWVQ